MENVVPISKLPDFIREAILQVNTGLYETREAGILVEMPESLQISVMVIKEWQSNELEYRSNKENSDNGTQESFSKDEGTNSSTDSGTNSSTDSGTNSSTDSGTNSSTDSGTNSSTDSGTNSSTDSGTNSSNDSGRNDGGSTQAGTSSSETIYS